MGAPGDIIDDRFELLERLGAGGMGTVWRARDAVLGREVALKEVRASSPTLSAQGSAVSRERVLREARALARVRHPHVVTIHQIVQPLPAPGTDELPQPWLVMELVPGRTLQDRTADRPLAPAEAARLGRQVLSALCAAHAVGIHHRDVKPANVMLREDGSAVLTDFGIAALPDAGTLTLTGEVVGSPEYMAPERIRGAEDAPAADLWSLGLVLYTAVEGTSPLRRTTTLATLTAVLEDPVPPPARAGHLAPVLSALLVRDPAERPDPTRLDALLAEVERGREPQWAQATVTARRPADVSTVGGREGATAARHEPRPARRSRVPLVVATVSLGVAVAATAALVVGLRPEDGGRPEAAARPSATADDDRVPAQNTVPPPRTPAPTSPPSLGSGPADTWVAQLASVEKTLGEQARDRQAAELRAKGVTDVRFLDSDAFASLRPGYWVFYRPGFADGREAVAYCREKGLVTRDTCVGRYVSDRTSDFVLQCYPTDRGVQPGSRCTRDRAGTGRQ
ncbi:serine/threonine-protein kinase [Streptomyces sp. NPDC002490]|uniref:serine/threonine-protein kinase n=1 Tax=Streptomyces sp. NPDC002490 TaxID=3154416 RepID=UPI0033188F71